MSKNSGTEEAVEQIIVSSLNLSSDSDDSDSISRAESESNSNGIIVGFGNDDGNDAVHVRDDEIGIDDPMSPPFIDSFRRNRTRHQIWFEDEESSRRVQDESDINHTSGSEEEGFSEEVEVELPHAYPINIETVVIPDAEIILNSNNQESERNLSNNNNDGHKNRNRCVTFLFLLFFVSNITLAFLPNRYMNMKNENDDDTDTLSVANNKTFVQVEELNSTSNSTYENDSSTAASSSSTTTSSFDFEPCFTDPIVIQTLEWEAHERGDDPSIPRTYHFCPNTTMNVFGINPIVDNFDYSSKGKNSVHPLMLFRSNVNILCGYGEDGDYYRNNCTFNGGYLHVLLTNEPFFVNYAVTTKVENITIDGFRFTGAKYGVNVVLRSDTSGLSVRNCRFDHNQYMTSSIIMTAGDVFHSRSLSVENSTFDENSYRVNKREQREGEPNLHIGVIYSFPHEESSSFSEGNPKINLHVSKSVFWNNAFFFLDSFDDEYFSSTGTGTIINLLRVVSHVDISETCFMNNSNYTSALMLIARSDVKDDDKDVNSVIKVSGNHFSENIPRKEDYDDSRGGGGVLSSFSSSSCGMRYIRENISDEECEIEIFSSSDDASCTSMASEA